MIDRKLASKAANVDTKNSVGDRASGGKQLGESRISPALYTGKIGVRIPRRRNTLGDRVAVRSCIGGSRFGYGSPHHVMTNASCRLLPVGE